MEILFGGGGEGCGGVLMALGKGFEIIYFLLGGSGLETYYRLNFFSKINSISGDCELRAIY